MENQTYNLHFASQAMRKVVRDDNGIVLRTDPVMQYGIFAIAPVGRGPVLSAISSELGETFYDSAMLQIVKFFENADMPPGIFNANFINGTYHSSSVPSSFVTSGVSNLGFVNGEKIPRYDLVRIKNAARDALGGRLEARI